MQPSGILVLALFTFICKMSWGFVFYAQHMGSFKFLLEIALWKEFLPMDLLFKSSSIFEVIKTIGLLNLCTELSRLPHGCCWPCWQLHDMAALLTNCFVWDSNIWGCSPPASGLLFFPRPFSLQWEPQNLNAGREVCVTARLTELVLCLRAHWP